MHLITLFRVLNPHQRCLQAKVKNRNEPKQVLPKSRDLKIKLIWTFDTEFPTIFNKSCTYIAFKSAVKHRQLSYGYPLPSGTYANNRQKRAPCWFLYAQSDGPIFSGRQNCGLIPIHRPLI